MRWNFLSQIAKKKKFFFSVSCTFACNPDKNKWHVDYFLIVSIQWVQRKKIATNYRRRFGHSLWSANQLPAQGVRGKNYVTSRKYSNIWSRVMQWNIFSNFIRMNVIEYYIPLSLLLRMLLCNIGLIVEMMLKWVRLNEKIETHFDGWILTKTILSISNYYLFAYSFCIAWSNSNHTFTQRSLIDLICLSFINEQKL